MATNLKFHKSHSAAFRQYREDKTFLYTVPCCKCGGEGKSDVYSNQFVCESCTMAASVENFFAAVAQIAEQQVAKKNHKATELHIIARVQFKENASAVLYGIQSGEKTYQVTVYDGRITGCAQASGEECQGFHFRHTCKHTELVAKTEAERASDVKQHLQDEATVHSCVSCGARVKKANSLCYDCCN